MVVVRQTYQGSLPDWMAVMQDVVRRWKETHSNFDNFAEKVAFQLNDTHPTIAVPELMRVLMDENQLGWSQAWDITSKVRLTRSATKVRQNLIASLSSVGTSDQPRPVEGISIEGASKEQLILHIA